MKTSSTRRTLSLVTGLIVGLPVIASSEPAMHELAPAPFRLPASPPIEFDLSDEIDQAREESLSQFRQQWRAEDGQIVGQLGQFDMPIASNSLFRLNLAKEAQENLAGFLAAREVGPTRESDSESLAAN